jgi:hypothetical protein
MRRVRLVADGSIVGHIEFYSLLLTGPGDYFCIPAGVLSDPDVQALAEALDRGEVVGQVGKYSWQAFLGSAVPVLSR